MGETCQEFPPRLLKVFPCGPPIIVDMSLLDCYVFIFLCYKWALLGNPRPVLYSFSSDVIA